MIEVFAGEVAEPVTTDFADEVGVESATAGPHGNVCSTTAGGEHHFAERVAALQHLIVGADEHVPREVANDAQTHTITLPMRNSPRSIRR